MGIEFNQRFFSENRKKLRTLFTGTAPIVLTAHGLMQRNNDASFPFRQDSSFWYLTGINDPDIVLVMDKSKEYLIIPQRGHSREAFDGQLDVEALARISGIELILNEKEGWKQLSARLKKTKHIATLASPPAYVEVIGLYTNPARSRMLERIKSINPSLELLDLRQHLARLRMVKQPEELAAIGQAVTLTEKAFKRAQSKLTVCNKEYELESIMSAVFRKTGYGHAYTPIVAAGKNACTLHYDSNSSDVHENDLVLLDVGAEVSLYAADITRTYAKGAVTKRQQAVHDTVMEVHAFALSKICPGTILKDYEKEVEAFMGEKLRELGLIKSIDHESVRNFYPHATSHFLGLDVHDIGDYERPLESGVVLTVEPGIYIPEEGIGIRIEDDVLVTNEGVRILSDNLPRELA